MPRPKLMHLLAAAGLAAALVAGLTGCDEIKSRREIQRGNRLYGEGRYREAVALYDSALTRTPSLAIGHHNAGLAYYKLFQPGDEKPENKALAEKAATHFAEYLRSNAEDQKIISLLTTIWLDSDQYDKALAFWSDVLARNPDSQDVMEKLANINRQAGQFDKALEWHGKRLALEKEPAGKAKVLVEIAQMEWSRLQKPELVDADRVAVVDQGIAALQQAQELDPKNATVQSLLGAMYQHRALAHQASWAKGIEAAAQRYHQLRFVEIQKAAGGQSTAAPAKAKK
jgi:tetratricopeptide (TPR) repeat protein